MAEGTPMDVSMAIAASGMAQASASLSASASVIARAEAPVPMASGGAVISNTSLAVPNLVTMLNGDPIAEVVNQISASLAFRANLAVFQAASRNVKSLIDTLA